MLGLNGTAHAMTAVATSGSVCSIRWVHASCLQQWLQLSRAKKCEVSPSDGLQAVLTIAAVSPASSCVQTALISSLTSSFLSIFSRRCRPTRCLPTGLRVRVQIQRCVSGIDPESAALAGVSSWNLPEEHGDSSLGDEGAPGQHERVSLRLGKPVGSLACSVELNFLVSWTVLPGAR